MRQCVWMLLLVCLIWAPVADAARTVRRFVLVAGANFGGSNRETLRYAVSDAERFVEILESMGGVEAKDRVLLREPSLIEFQRALSNLRIQVTEAPRASERIEVILYYSGHADEAGLLLGNERFAYRDLRRQLDAVAADVYITVLDACASGAITRLKGGQRQKAFMVDASSDMTGYAFLTSSSENEAAQESDRIRGSFFTHYLISGLRGAADVTGDGRVTLNEAYQFAFHSTLHRTEKTRGGAQHPAYDIKMTGTGDVVMTDVRHMSAGLLLDAALNGRLFVRNAKSQLVAELYKAAGQVVELGLAPGRYEINFEHQKTMLHTSITIEKGQRFLLEQKHFEMRLRENTTARGGAKTKPKERKRSSFRYPHRLSGKFRIERSIGIWDPGDDSAAWVFAYWPTEHVAINHIRSGFSTKSTRADSLKTGVSSRLITLRIYLPIQFLRSPIRPFAEGGVGRYKGREVGNEVDEVEGFYWGGGLDVPVWGDFIIGGRVGYNHLGDFSGPVDGRIGYSGIEYAVGFSFIFF